ncbi:LOW QUALITY PROTEIN: Glycolate oxidase subunit [Parasponia andersonii]|uniref:Glycolate oxidase subunit n=1 Tax=Parasponia andersonii TaxID=3476 RepID=A0A2P5AQK9_PARAD|nr:LOW QUALITY PROTEIN: Glycolate oxidase subunit [Parasponia andersonii]
MHSKRPVIYFIPNSTIQNPRFSSPSIPKPLLIITPSNASHVQATVYCSLKHGFQIRTRSGGHDYVGLSYVSEVPFVIMDLGNLILVTVDVHKTAWVEAGATIGEVYYRIAEKSVNLGFPAVFCHTVGVGGHFSGGGYRVLTQKCGLAAN